MVDLSRSEYALLFGSQASNLQLRKTLLSMGGFYWQLMDMGGLKGLATLSTAKCQETLMDLCVHKPATWNKMQLYKIPRGRPPTPSEFTDYTVEFLLTRGPYALLGFSWAGCTNGHQFHPRAKEWDEDFGEPVRGAACSETKFGSGIFVRRWTKAMVHWDCNTGTGGINMTQRSVGEVAR